MRRYGQSNRTHPRTRLISLVCAALLFGATVSQGVSLCLCPPAAAAVQAQDACPCHGCSREAQEDGGSCRATLSASAHTCDHLLFSALPPAERTADAAGSTVGQPTVRALPPRLEHGYPPHGAAHGRPGPWTPPAHAPPSLACLQRRLC